MRLKTFLPGALCFMFLAAGLACLGEAASSGNLLKTPPLEPSSAKIETGNDGTLWIKSKSGELASSAKASGEGKEPGKALKVSIETGGDFLRDSSPCFKFDASSWAKAGNASVTIRFYGGNPAKEAAGKTCRVEIWAKSSVDGAPCKLYFEGEREGSKHYWKALDAVIGPKWRKLSFEEPLPKDLKLIGVRFDLNSPAEYSLAEPGIFLKGEQAEPGQVKTGNLILNGGAERAWYGITASSPENVGTSDGLLLNWDGKSVIAPPYAKWSIDDKVSFSGRHSFRATAGGGGLPWGRINFNPVPFEPGKPAYFSVMMKADRKCKVTLCLFVACGIAYGGGERVVDTEWRKYTMEIPEWGKQGVGAWMINDVVTGYGCGPRLVYPQVGVPDVGTLWVDDAVYSMGKDVLPSKDPVLLSGSLDKGSAAYQPGEAVKASYQIENASDVPLELEAWTETYDYFARLRESGRPERISLAKGASVERNLSFVPGFLGPLNFIYKVKNLADGSVTSHSSYLGVFKRAEKLHPWYGIDTQYRSNAKALSASLKDFGIGSVRVWTEYKKFVDRMTGFDEAKHYKTAGMYVLMNVSDYKPFMPVDFLVPIDPAESAAYVAKLAASHKGYVDAYEIINEPNIWRAPESNPDPAKYTCMSVERYVSTLEAFSKAIKAADPKVKIAGPTTCHTDVIWTSNVLDKGGWKYFDIVTEHPYRNRPEAPDYEKDLDGMKAVIAKCGKKLPLFASECGYIMPASPESETVSEMVRDSVAMSVRTQLIAYANGVEKYFHFGSGFSSDGTDWRVFYLGSPAFPGVEVPNPYLYAIRNMMERLDGAKPLGRCDIGTAFRCYVFERDGRRVASLWKCQEENRPSSVELRSLPEDFRIFDFMGNAVAVKGRSFEVSPSPSYIETSLSFAEIKALLAGASFSGVGAPFAMSVSVLNADSFAVDVENRINRPISGKIEATAPGVLAGGSSGEFKDIQPGASGGVLFKTTTPIGLEPKKVHVKAVLSDSESFDSADFDIKALLCHRTDRKLKMDGDLSDWPASAVPVVIGKEKAFKKAPELWKPADDGIKASVRTAWSDDGLYVAIEVEKPKFFQDAKGPMELWKGDCVQVAFDPLKNGRVGKAGEYNYDDDDFEYSIGLIEGKPMVYRHHASSVAYDGFVKNIGIATGEVAAAVKASNGKTVYEMLFPPRSFSPFRLQKGSSMRWSFIANLNNGEGRMGWLELTPGIGDGKSPGSFMDLIIVE